MMKWLGYLLVVTMLFSVCTMAIMPIAYSEETGEDDCCGEETKDEETNDELASEEETNEEETNEEETNEEETERGLPLGTAYGFTYMRYYIFCAGVAWAKVYFIAEDGTEYTAYSNGGGVYYARLPRGNYTAYAEYAWYKSEEMEVKIDRGRTPINFYVEIPYSRGGRPQPRP
jgi:hypothetical protein